MDFWGHVDALADRLSSIDYFALLGVSREVTPLELQDAYYSRLRYYHPDGHAGGGREHQQKLALICARVGEAYRTLNNPARRAEYLAGLAAGETRSRPNRRSALNDPRDPSTDKGRSLLAGARELAGKGNVAGARAKLELALQFEPDSRALRAALDELELAAAGDEP